MNMRVSTSQIYRTGTNGIQDLQSSLYTLQNQVSTGRKMVTPADDPVGAAQALVVTQSKSVNELYLKNQASADTKLSALDTTLKGVNDELANIYEKGIAAGNGSYGDAQRAAIASELQSRLANLVTLANSQDGTGRYIFSGVQSTTTPFSPSGNTSPYSMANPYMSYNGDDGAQVVQVSASQYLATNEPGSNVFYTRVTDSSGVESKRGVFDSIQNLINFLKTPGVSASNPTYSQSLSEIQSAMDNVSSVQASVGARQSSLDGLKNMSEDRKLQYKEQLSNLQDLDYAKALSDVTQQKVQLEAAQSTFSATAKLTLFNYI
jgi:flagellar hook-associated protein 3 FlgL